MELSRYKREIERKADEANTNIKRSLFSMLRTVSRKPWKVFGPEKPFLVNRYLKTESCTRLKLLVRNVASVYTRNMWKEQLCNHKVWDSAPAFRVRKLFGTFEKRTRLWLNSWLHNSIKVNEFTTMEIYISSSAGGFEALLFQAFRTMK